MKGTPSQGKHNRKRHHQICRRCGSASLLRSCASCGFKKTKKIRTYSWTKK